MKFIQVMRTYKLRHELPDAIVQSPVNSARSVIPFINKMLSA